MTRWLVASLTLVTLFGAGQTALAHEHPSAPVPAPFTELKMLVGEWTGDMPGGKFTINYRLSAGGSVLVETMFPGHPHEMVNVYHPDGERVRMTHYCAGGNQPHLKLDSSGHSSKKLAEWHFVADSVSNLASPDADYMNDLVMTLQDKDHLVATWGGLSHGKPQPPSIFTMVRTK